MTSGVIEKASTPLAQVPGWPGNRASYRQYDQDRVGFLRLSHDRFGETFRFDDDTLITCNPDLIRTVLTRSNREFIAEETMVDTEVQDDRLHGNIARWMTGRKLAGQTMRHIDLSGMAADLVSDLTTALAPATIEQPATTIAVMSDFASKATMRYCLGEHADTYHSAGAEASRRAVKLMAMSRLLPGWLPFGPGRAWRQAETRATRVMGEVIRTQRAAGQHSGSLLDILLAAGLDDETINLTLGPTIGAAFGVPGTALTWALICLLGRPDWQARIADESRRARTENRNIVEAMPWTADFVREVLRLYAPTWLMARTARTPTTLGSVALPRGARVMFSPLIVHTDPRWWDDPLRFDPDRWQTATPTSREYLPFGSGPRICVGAILGTTHMVWTLGYLCAHYRFQAAELDTHPVYHALYKPTACRIRFLPRTSDPAAE